MSFGKFLREKRKARGLTLQQIANVFGIWRGSVSDWENDKTRPDVAKVPELAKLLGVAEAELLRHFMEKHRNGTQIVQLKNEASGSMANRTMPKGVTAARKLPVISWSQAAEWGAIVDSFKAGDAQEWVLCPFPGGDQSFVLQVPGESMFNPAGEVSFREGDYVSVDPAREPQHRSFVVAARRGEHSVALRQLLIENDGRMYLHTLNPAWPVRYQEVDDDTTIVGVVTGQWRSL